MCRTGTRVPSGWRAAKWPLAGQVEVDDGVDERIGLGRERFGRRPRRRAAARISAAVRMFHTFAAFRLGDLVGVGADAFEEVVDLAVVGERR